MLYQQFDIPKYNWSVYAFYDTTGDDIDDIMMCLYDMGCTANIAKQAYENISSDQRNTGLTYSKDRATCIVLSRATDKQNFAHTYTHEIAHCGMHIAKEYGIDPYGEELCYIIGDLGAEMLPYASKYMCDCCNKKRESYE